MGSYPLASMQTRYSSKASAKILSPSTLSEHSLLSLPTVLGTLSSTFSLGAEDGIKYCFQSVDFLCGPVIKYPFSISTVVSRKSILSSLIFSDLYFNIANQSNSKKCLLDLIHISDLKPLGPSLFFQGLVYLQSHLLLGKYM